MTNAGWNKYANPEHVAIEAQVQQLQEERNELKILLRVEKKSRDSHNELATKYFSELQLALTANAALREALDVTTTLLKRLQQWDHMQPPTADGAYWLAEIAAALAATTPAEVRDPSAKATLARMPVINDPAISEALADLFEDESATTEVRDA